MPVTTVTVDGEQVDVGFAAYDALRVRDLSTALYRLLLISFSDLGRPLSSSRGREAGVPPNQVSIPDICSGAHRKHFDK